MTDPIAAPLAPADAQYAGKADDYFGNARHDIVALLPTGAGDAVLEVGCGSGGTARAARTAGKAGRYVGIEIHPPSAERAADALDEVVLGNVETLDLTRFAGRFDALVLSEVIEHLVDPWRAVEALSRCLRPGAFVAASSPNVAHWHVLRALVRGRFDYRDVGVMDRTHLRWFTPATYAAMFEEAGIAVDRVGPIRRPGPAGRAVTALSGGRLAHLFWSQIMIVGHKR